MLRSVGALIACLLATTASAATLHPVASCNTTIARGEAALVIADLDCASGEDAIRIATGTVYLNGHRISGAHYAVVGGERGTVKIVGPGELSGNGDTILTQHNLKIDNVSIHDNGAGMYVLGGLRAHVITVTDNSDFGINVDGKVTGDAIDSSRNHVGVKVERGIRARGVTIADNRGSGLAVTEGSVALRDSSLTGNGYAEAGTVDLLSEKRPRLSNTVCGTSLSILDGGVAGPPWGVCTSD